MNVMDALNLPYGVIDGSLDNDLADSACDMNDDPADVPELEAWGFHEVTVAEIELQAFVDRFALPFDC